jgi:hypothetical protein
MHRKGTDTMVHSIRTEALNALLSSNSPNEDWLLFRGGLTEETKGNDDD